MDDLLITLSSMDPLPQKSERKDAAENRRLILETAARLFAEKSVAEVCMSDIAAAAGIGKGTLYRRFANKGELCLSLLDGEYKTFQDRRIAQMRAHNTQQEPALAQLIDFLEHLALFIAQHLELISEIDDARVQSPAGDINSPHWWNELTIRGLLQEAAEQGEISVDLDLNYVAAALLAPLNSRILRSHLEERNYPLTRIIKGLTGVVNALKS